MNFDHLPNEITLIVLNYLNDFNDYSSCLQVNKKFYNMGQFLNWENKNVLSKCSIKRSRESFNYFIKIMKHSTIINEIEYCFINNTNTSFFLYYLLNNNLYSKYVIRDKFEVLKWIIFNDCYDELVKFVNLHTIHYNQLQNIIYDLVSTNIKKISPKCLDYLIKYFKIEIENFMLWQFIHDNLFINDKPDNLKLFDIMLSNLNKPLDTILINNIIMSENIKIFKLLLNHLNTPVNNYNFVFSYVYVPENIVDALINHSKFNDNIRNISLYNVISNNNYFYTNPHKLQKIISCSSFNPNDHRLLLHFINNNQFRIFRLLISNKNFKHDLFTTVKIMHAIIYKFLCNILGYIENFIDIVIILCTYEGVSLFVLIYFISYITHLYAYFLKKKNNELKMLINYLQI
jgi:hypothetical protein